MVAPDARVNPRGGQGSYELSNKIPDSVPRSRFMLNFRWLNLGQ
jgi:hypothetical protein